MTAAQRLRIAMVVDRFPNETFLAQQVASLLRRDVDVHVLCQIHDREAVAGRHLDDVDLGGRVHPWPGRGRPLSLATAAARTLGAAGHRHPAALVAAIAAERGSGRALPGRLLFDARLAAVGADVVHFQFADLARHRVHVAGAIDAAFTSSFRGYDLAYAGLDEPGFYDRLWPVLDGAHTLGDDLRSLAEERGCPPDLEWTIIPPAVDTAAFTPAERASGSGTAGDPLRVVSVGRLHWKKGHLDALSAIATLRDSGRPVHYRIVGSGPHEDAVRWAIRDLALDDSVELIGQAEPATVRAQLRWAEVFLHAALTEGFGNAVLEAQAMALPVIATDAEGLRENVVDGVTGYIVPRRRPDAMAERLGLLADQPEARRSLGAAGRERVVTEFSLDANIDAFVAFFERAAARAAGAIR